MALRISTGFYQRSIHKLAACSSTNKIDKRGLNYGKLETICKKQTIELNAMNCSKANFHEKNDILRCLINMSKSNQKKLKISIEGNIASGKSSIVEYLRKKLSKNVLSPSKCFALASNQAAKNTTKYHDYDESLVNECLDDINTPVNLKLITEPVNLWRNLEGNNLLELMYTDPHRWAFAFHSYVQLTMLEKHLELNQMESIRDLENMNSNENLSKCNISIMERSLYSAKYCFVENIFKSKILKPVEYEILDKWFNFMIENHDCTLDVIFYLRTEPETCMKRLNQRGRPEETSTITIEYLQNLHDFHENWLIKGNKTENAASTHESSHLLKTIEFYRPPLVIVIDGNQSIDDVYKTIETETRNAMSVRMAN